ncbi:MAG: hypothetical protein AB7G37_12850 [Solirubrobacteraceae bacterium]
MPQPDPSVLRRAGGRAAMTTLATAAILPAVAVAVVETSIYLASVDLRSRNQPR